MALIAGLNRYTGKLQDAKMTNDGELLVVENSERYIVGYRQVCSPVAIWAAATTPLVSSAIAVVDWLAELGTDKRNLILNLVVGSGNTIQGTIDYYLDAAMATLIKNVAPTEWKDQAADAVLAYAIPVADQIFPYMKITLTRSAGSSNIGASTVYACYNTVEAVEV